ncbi:MAG TPA: hypothetical protein VHK90_18155 [Thermoanaerobaculia bacterium]|nr:hypothetical protein [Thermoanaerobaculia bacterium]
MATTRATTSNATAAATATDGSTTTPPPDSPTPTITHYQQLATEFMAALDEIAQIIPKLEAAHISTANFVRSHLNVPIEFLGTATAAVEQTAELQGVKKLDVASARDTLQFIDAFRPVLDKVSAFAKNLQFTLNSRKASLASEALQIYDIAKGLARDPNSATVASLVANMKRDLGRRGRPKTPPALRKVAPAPGIGVPTPRLLPGNEPEGWTRDDAEPRG